MADQTKIHLISNDGGSENVVEIPGEVKLYQDALIKDLEDLLELAKQGKLVAFVSYAMRDSALDRSAEQFQTSTTIRSDPRLYARPHIAAGMAYALMRAVSI